jgi:NADH dehydrogenase FAD-containing subunit
VIVGASFAGLFLLKKLIKGLKTPLQVTLIDKNSYFELTTSVLGAILNKEQARRINMSY